MGKIGQGRFVRTLPQGGLKWEATPGQLITIDALEMKYKNNKISVTLSRVGIELLEVRAPLELQEDRDDQADDEGGEAPVGTHEASSIED